MTSYDSYLNQKIDEYNTPCQLYKDENRQDECSVCDTPCDDYLENVDLIDLFDNVAYYAAYIQEKPDSVLTKKYAYKLKLIKAELDKRAAA